MFTTVDSVEARYVKIFLKKDDEYIPVEPPDFLDKLLFRTRSVPTEENLELLAQRLAGTQWAVKGDNLSDLLNHTKTYEIKDRGDIKKQAPDEAVFRLVPVDNTNKDYDESEIIDYSSIVIELWRYEFDRKENTLSGEKFIEVVVPNEN